MSVLAEICAKKAEHVASKKLENSVSDLELMIKHADKPRGFIQALKAKPPSLIAEVKKASPSKGVIREDFDAVEIAKTYERAGAACLSVLTDEPYFQGHDEYFLAVHKSVKLPMLRKDFMVDSYQVLESRAMEADCVLLIMACLSDEQAKEFYDLATQLGMDSLFEIHDEEELERALKLSPQMVGVNNRNLKTLDVDLQTGLDLSRNMPPSILKVAESGLGDYKNIQDFSAQGFDAFLVGESLMRQENIENAVHTLMGKTSE